MRGINIPGQDKLQAVFTVRGSKNVPYGEAQKFTVMQRQGGQIMGGSTFEIRL